jgi:hypothetical protein
MRGGFVPGLSALDTSAQIIAWAIVFGYSQQFLTHFDQQANTVLRNVDSPAHPQLEPPSDRNCRTRRSRPRSTKALGDGVRRSKSDPWPLRSILRSSVRAL